jgi:diguanylate cyclase (GGDEF)-like protein
MDVDRLKQINDSFGHFEGARALKRTADVLEETFRDSDVLARLGGDEFTVLAVEASGRSEARIKTRLFECLKSISAKPSRYEISLGVGLARFDPWQPHVDWRIDGKGRPGHVRAEAATIEATPRDGNQYLFSMAI